jgi:glutamyl-tRNA synthetase
MTSAPIVTRFAPSPTGHLHIGGARTALFCWAFAKKAGGRFMIRIEDTDQARSSDESARGILDDLAWLGIEWDDGPSYRAPHNNRHIGAHARDVGPYFQAQRLAIYNAYIEHLVRLGRAYPAFETSEQQEADRKAAAAKKQTYKYPRPSDVKFGEFNASRWERALKGEPHVVRFVMPDTEIRVSDQVLGEVKFARGEVDDFVIRKQDGFPTYHFAVVIDDELMGVTHVLRAQEHLINTPKHVALQGALTRLRDDRDAGKGSDGTKFRTPFYGHMPLIFNADGSKMSKRDKAKAARKYVVDQAAKPGSTMNASHVAHATKLDEATVASFIAGDTDAVEIAEKIAHAFKLTLPEIEVWDYRTSGYLPEAITNFLALLGWSPGVKTADGKDLEKFDMKFLAENFAIERIGKTPARFDRVKLLSFNGDYIAALSDDAFITRLLDWANQYEPDFAKRLSAIAPDRKAMLVKMAKGRCKTLRDALKVMDFALVSDADVQFDRGAIDKHLLTNGGAGKVLLHDFAELLALAPTFDAPSIDKLVADFAGARKIKMGELAQPIRIGVTGSTVSPPLGETLAVLGKASVNARIARCLALCN